MRVLIVDEGFIGSLHTAIGLRDAGVDAVLLGAVGSRRSYEASSFCAMTGPVPADARFLPFARNVAASRGCDVIMPATEPAMLALHAASATLPAPLFPRMSGSQAALIADKPAMSALAAAAGVMTPVQIEVSTPREVHDALRIVGLPAVIKATFGRGGDGTSIVRDNDAAERAVLHTQRNGRTCIVQQYISGPTYLVGGLFERGRAVRLYAGEKVEQQPPLTGPAARIRSVRDTALLDAACTVFAALEWTGLASADFVRSDDGHYHFLEVNPRPWGSIAAAGDAGVDLFGPLASLIGGGSPEPDTVFANDVESRVLPLYLLNRRRWMDTRTPGHIAADLASRQGAAFGNVRLAAHVLHRLLRVRANWPSGAERSRVR